MDLLAKCFAKFREFQVCAAPFCFNYTTGMYSLQLLSEAVRTEDHPYCGYGEKHNSYKLA